MIATLSIEIQAVRASIMQVKGRMFRSKTLIVEEPIFLNDAEQSLGDTLAHWEHEAVGGVVAQFIRLKVAELQLIHESSAASKASNSSKLQALDSVLHLHMLLSRSDSLLKTQISDTLTSVKAVAAQISSALDDTESSKALIKFAAKYPTAVEDGIIQLPQEIDLESLLHVLQDLSSTPQHAKSISWILSRLAITLQQASVDTILLNAAALCKTLSKLQIDMNDQLEECCSAYLAIQSCLLSIAQLSSTGEEMEHAAGAVEAMLEIMLSLSKGTTTHGVWSALKFDKDMNVASLAIVPIQDLAQYIFSTPGHRSSNVSLAHATVLETLYRSAGPWAQIFRRLPYKMGLCWLLVMLSSMKALARHADLSGNATALVDIENDALSLTSAGLESDTTSSWLQLGVPGAMCMDATDGEEQECYSLCMLELPPGESRDVQLGWKATQVAVGLGFACRKFGARGDEEKERLHQFLEEARISEALAQALNASQVWRNQAALVCLHVLRCVSQRNVKPEELFVVVNAPILELLSTFLVRVIVVSSHDPAGPPGSNISNSPLRLLHAATARADGFKHSSILFGIASALCCFLYAHSVDPAVQLTREERTVVDNIIEEGCRSLYRSLATNISAVPFVLNSIAIAVRPVFDGMFTSNHGDSEASMVMEIMERIDRVWMHGLERGDEQSVWVLVACLWVSDALQCSMSPSIPNQPAQQCERAAAECLSVQDFFIQRHSTDSSTAVAELILLSELVYRFACFPDQLAPIVDNANIRALVRKRLDALHLFTGMDSERTIESKIEAFSGLMSVFDSTTGQGISTEQAGSIPIHPIIGSPNVASIVAASDEMQSSKKKGFNQQMDVTTTTKMNRKASVQEGSLEADLLCLNSASGSSQILSLLDWLVHRQEQLDTKRVEVISQLRSWRRRAEKAAARPMGEEVGPGSGEGREGDVPLCLAESQRMSWELWDRVREDIKGYHDALRKRVCQQYLAVDEQTLQETSEVYADGQRIFCQLRDTRHEAICRSLRADAHAVATNLMTNNAKEVNKLVMELYGTEVIVNEARTTGPDLTSVVVNSLLDGSTPSPAAPFFVSLVEKTTEAPGAVHGAGVVSNDHPSFPGLPQAQRAQAQLLVPKIIRSLAPKDTDSEAPLSIDHGLRLLRAVLDPDALLDAKRLVEFGAALRLVVDLCPECKDGAAAMIRQFDAQRFAFLVAENSAQNESMTKDVSSTTAFSSDSSAGSLAGVLSTIAACFRGASHSEEAQDLSYQSALSSTASSLLEGLLSCRPAEQFLPSLKVVIEAMLVREGSPYSPEALTSAVSPSLRLLSHVPPDMLSHHTIASSLEVLASYLSAQTLEKSTTLSPSSPLWDVIAPLYGADVSSTLRSKDFGKSESHRDEKHYLNLISALLSAMRWMAASATMDQIGPFGESLQRMLTIILRVPREPSTIEYAEADTTAWSVDWAWKIYETHLTDFGSSSFVGSFPDGYVEMARGAFETVWTSIPWHTYFASSLHLVTDDAQLREKVTRLRDHLRFAADGAALHVIKAVKQQDWEALVERALRSDASTLSTDLALLIVESFVAYDATDLPRFLLNEAQLGGPGLGDSSDEPLLSSSLVAVTLLAHADWSILNSLDSTDPAHNDAHVASWLVSRFLSTLGWSTTEGNPLDRLVNVSHLLSAGAIASSSGEALSVASSMIHPLVGLSICRCAEPSSTMGEVPFAGQVFHGDGDNDENAFPEIPEELLQGTVEMQAIEELRSRQEIVRLMKEEEGAVSAVTPVGTTGRGVVEVLGCLRMTPAQVVALYEFALVPLAKAAIVKGTMPGEGDLKAQYGEMGNRGQHPDSVIALCLPLTRRPTTILTTISIARFPSSNANIPWYEESEQAAVEGSMGGEGLGSEPEQEPLFVFAGPEKDSDSALTSQHRTWTSARYWGDILKGKHSLRGFQIQRGRGDEETDNDLDSSHRFKQEVATLLIRCARNDQDFAGPLFRCCMYSFTHSRQRTILYDVAENLVIAALSRADNSEEHTGKEDTFAQDVTVLDKYNQINVSENMKRNRLVQAISDIDAGQLTECARRAAAAHHPFLAAFFLETARRSATLLEKMSWQRIVIDVFGVAAEADVSVTDGRSVLVLSLWLAALSWLDDPRWRKLPPGGHTLALGNLLDSLDSRVEILHSVTPEELMDGVGSGSQWQLHNGVGGGRPMAFSRDLIAKARAKVAGAVEGVFHRDKAEEKGGETGTFLPPTYHGYTIPEASSDGGDGGESIHAQSLDGDQREGERRGLRAGIRSFGRSLSQAPGRVGRLLSLGARGKKEEVVSPQEIEQPAVDNHELPMLTESRKGGDATEVDVIIRIGLAAYAVAAYVRSVMDPRLTRRTVSGQSGMDTAATQPLPATSTHRRGNSSWTGSRHLEEAQLGEMDTLVEAQWHVDGLKELERSPLLTGKGGEYAEFWGQMPSLLTSATGVHEFQRATAKLLLPTDQEAALVITTLTE